jgi:hypothetical protein
MQYIDPRKRHHLFRPSKTNVKTLIWEGCKKHSSARNFFRNVLFRQYEHLWNRSEGKSSEIENFFFFYFLRRKKKNLKIGKKTIFFFFFPFLLNFGCNACAFVFVLGMFSKCIFCQPGHCALFWKGCVVEGDV